MKTFAIREAQQDLERLADLADAEPIRIERASREALVLVAERDFYASPDPFFVGLWAIRAATGGVELERPTRRRPPRRWPGKPAFVDLRRSCAAWPLPVGEGALPHPLDATPHRARALASLVSFFSRTSLAPADLAGEGEPRHRPNGGDEMACFDVPACVNVPAVALA
jgi:hypothetical protein